MLIIKQLLIFLACSWLCLSCNDSPETQETVAETPELATPEVEAPQRFEGPLKMSLAQWSLHRAYLEEGEDPYNFAADAKALGFEGVEYVSGIYADDIKSGSEHGKSVMELMSKLDAKARAAGVEEVLIMIDGEGDLGNSNELERLQAVENHKHWIDAAWGSGIPTIRVNAGGQGSKAEVKTQAVKSLRELGAYAQPKEVNVVVENHGGYSSDPVWLADVMATVGLPNVGILPDFGNFCRKHAPGDWSNCLDRVPSDSTYAAVAMWMPYTHAVSAKSYAFDATGEETSIDYARMLDTVRTYGYRGFVGVEYEGTELPEREGIVATKRLLERY